MNKRFIIDSLLVPNLVFPLRMQRHEQTLHHYLHMNNTVAVATATKPPWITPRR